MGLEKRSPHAARGRSRRWVWRLLLGAVLATVAVTPAQSAPFLVKDIADANQGSDPFGLTEADGRLYFTANHKIPPGAGAESWRSDAAGTAFLADGEVIGALNDGVLIARCVPLEGCVLLRGDASGAVELATILSGSFDAHLSAPTIAGGFAFFTAEDSDGGSLWRTDGTVAGTKSIVDFGAQPPFGLTASGGRLYFARCDDTGCALWTSDGTSAAPVATVIPGPLTEDDDRSVFALTDVAGTLYFATCTRFAECELWQSDGTEDGTADIAAFDPNNDPDSDDWEEPVLIALGSRLLFYAVDEEDDKALWSTDGTTPDTIRLADIDDRDPQAVVGGGDRLFFRGVDEDGDRELWVSNGTTGGTQRVADLNPTGSSDPSRLCASAAGVVFMACDEATGCEPWASDGTEPGTVRVADVNPGPGSSGFGDCRRGSGERVYFAATSMAAGREMWRTDGTPAGTAQVADINPGPAGSNPREFLAIDLAQTDDRVFFTACQETTGCEVWESDGTPGGTKLIADLEGTGVGAEPAKLTLANGFVFFLASDTAAGRELWRTDGTGAGTIRLTDVRPGFESTIITDLTPIDGGILFTAGNAPWTSDGTIAGTMPLAAPGTSANCTTGEYTPLGGKVFFRASSTDAGCELWQTDGTPGGTARAVDIVLGPTGSSPNRLVRVGQTLFFVAIDATHGAELWKSDGTAEGTKLVKNIALEGTGPNDPPLSAGLADLTASGGLLFFTAFNYGCSCSDTELWRSDGTEEGTFQVKDITPGPSGSEPTLLTDVDGTLFFRACEPTTGCELWRSDGTTDGTRLVAEANDGTGGTINNLVATGGTLYFSARDEAGNDTLWTSDGTPANTRPVTSLPQGGDGSKPRGFTNVGGKLLYVVSDLDHGSELWTSDGTPAGTRRLTDVWAGPGSSISELSMALLNGAVFFQATDPEHGAELWGMPSCEGEPGCVSTTTTSTTVPTTTTTIPTTSTTSTTIPAGSTTTTIVTGSTTSTTVVTPSTTTTTVTSTPPTTTSTLPQAACTADDQCPRSDECVDVHCVLGTCAASSAATFARTSCELRRFAAGPTCAADGSSRLDRLVHTKAGVVVHLVDAAGTATKPAKARRLLKRARATLGGLQRRIGKSRTLSEECRTMLVADLSGRRQQLSELTPPAR